MDITIIGNDRDTALFLAEKAGYTVVPSGGAALNLEERLTASKIQTCEWLETNGYVVPARFPEGSEPYIVRPDGETGSRGIWVTEDFCEAGGAINAGFLVQEFLQGPVHCAQVTGRAGDYTVHPILQLETDDRFIARSATLTDDPALAADAAKIADQIGLNGYLRIIAINGHIVSMDDRLCGQAAKKLYELCGTNVLAALF